MCPRFCILNVVVSKTVCVSGAFRFDERFILAVEMINVVVYHAIGDDMFGCGSEILVVGFDDDDYKVVLVVVSDEVVGFFVAVVVATGGGTSSLCSVFVCEG